MNPIAQKVAIAKATGWWGIEGGGGYEVGVPPWATKETHEFEKDRWVPRMDLPDYPADLNAIHDAEDYFGLHFEPILNSKTGKYREELMAVCIRDKHHDIFCATAAQRAEALLRTLNLWVE